MPWCPKCKTEYREGVLTCVDCGTELVNEEPRDYEYVALYSLEQEELAQKVVEYFAYSKLESHYEFSEEDQAYTVLVRDTDLKQAKKLFNAFYTVELEQLIEKENAKKAQAALDEAVSEETSDTSDDSTDLSESEPSLETKEEVEMEHFVKEEEEEKHKVAKMLRDGGAYEKKSDKCKDLKSTAFTFFLFGVALAIFLVLNLMKVITYLENPFQIVLFSALTIGFFIVAINSLQRSKKAAQDAKLEEETTKELMDWMTAHITHDVISTFADESEAEEIRFMKIMDGIKVEVTKTFGELDDAYLDYITEEFYNNHIEA